MSQVITTEEQLEALSGAVGEASFVIGTAKLHPLCRPWIEASPLAVLAMAVPGRVVVDRCVSSRG